MSNPKRSITTPSTPAAKLAFAHNKTSVYRRQVTPRVNGLSRTLESIEGSRAAVQKLGLGTTVIDQEVKELRTRRADAVLETWEEVK
jgi:hypothetical protein